MKTRSHGQRLTLGVLPTPAKALATCIIITLAFGMVGAVGQIIVHDIIPSFFSETGNQNTEEKAGHRGMAMSETEKVATPSSGRGDLFSDLKETVSPPKAMPFYKNEQFVWTLKWSHIHLFGMNMIFILMGLITLMLNTSVKSRTWLVVLPFIGVIVDILAMWLKAFVSPIFFWLHIPGGGIFAVVFGYVSLRAMCEMWRKPSEALPSH